MAICCVTDCGASPTLYKQGTKEFCKAHRAEAIALGKKMATPISDKRENNNYRYKSRYGGTYSDKAHKGVKFDHPRGYARAH
jgi:hypothetical protein